MTKDFDYSHIKPQADNAAWKAIVAKYQQPSTWRALWQIVDPFVPYGLLWYLMYLSLAVSWWLVLPLALIAGALVVRVFIIFHDCGHGSFLNRGLPTTRWASLRAYSTFTPYYHWRWEHSIHHGTAGDLDRRGTGDVWTLTVQEYLESSRWRKFAYRLARNPVVLFVIAPLSIVCDQATIRIRQGQAARTPVCPPDEPGPSRIHSWDEFDFWRQGVRSDSVNGVDGCGRPWGVAVLCPAPI